MGIFPKIFGRGSKNPQGQPAQKSQSIRTTANAPFQIQNPVIGFVCVAPEHQQLMEADKAAIGPLFSECRSSTNQTVTCHILFLYCNIDETGSLPGFKMRVRDFIKASGAYVAVVASENEGANYMQSLNPKNDWPANIVLVINRRGEIFPSFFQKLFNSMQSGTSMLMAWVQLAPQIPNHDHPDCPSTIMAAEAGHIVLG
ncbi:MAG: hypothetical protein LBF16_05940 [Pseudomonadales bacterium]|jgi:hypothetical protein|nr:hypothetical protein [Pseudomonadales bacterium]